MNKKIQDQLRELAPQLEELVPYLQERLEELNKTLTRDPLYGQKERLFSEKQTLLITYADQFQNQGENVFDSLKSFMENDLHGSCSYVHLLPFNPWTSDDGFSPIDYQKVDPDLGTWDDVERIPFPKMYDCVFNHISQKSEFFQRALTGDIEAQKLFHIFSEEEYGQPDFQENIKKVVRPRTTPLMSPYKMGEVDKYAWTTFSSDQIDTNLTHPEMVRYIFESFFLYIEKSARMLRVDAVPFMWKELGTNCTHHPKTHLFVKLLRSLIDEIKVPILLITDSNVPHQENITYWGSGEDEAHVIYNFSLAPLVLHGLEFGTAHFLKKWAQDVFNIPKGVTFLNFTATHDGIGMRGLEGIVDDEDIDKLCRAALERGGQVGKKTSRDGSFRPYELNITWSSMMKSPDLSQEDWLRKVIHSHALVMFLPGIGAHYVHNFLGTLNWQEGLKESGIARRLNRKKVAYPLELKDEQWQVLERLVEWTQFKNSHKAFHPKASFELISCPEQVFAFSREFEGQVKRVYFNLSCELVKFDDVELLPYDLKVL